MPLHRIFEISGGFDPAWSVTQSKPSPTGLDATIRTPTAGRLLWWCVGYDGAGLNAIAVAGTGATFDARLVYATPGSGNTALEYVGLQAISVANGGSEFPVGYAVTELDLPQGFEGWIQVIAYTPGSSTATHLRFSYVFTERTT